MTSASAAAASASVSGIEPWRKDLSGRRTVVAVCGHFGCGNYGNEATLSAVLARLGRSEYDPIVFCDGPEEAARTHGVRARRLSARTAPHGPVGAAWRLLRQALVSFAACFRVDAVMIAGSGGLERYGSGPFGFPFTIWVLSLGARIARRPFLMVDIGVQELPTALGRFFARKAGRSATYRSFRDDISRNAMVSMGVSAAIADDVIGDLVFGLPPERVPKLGGVVVGVMDYRRRDAYGSQAVEVHRQYVDRCRRLIESLRRSGHTVRVVGGDDADAVVGRELADQFRDGAVTYLDVSTPHELLAALAEADVAVASRYHTLVMSLLAGTPVIPIGYSAKHVAALHRLGLPTASFDIETFEPVEVALAVEGQLDNRDEVAGRIVSAVETARSRLDAEWLTLHGVLRRRRSRP